MIARLLLEEEDDLALVNFNSFLKVNRALYACLIALFGKKPRGSTTSLSAYSRTYFAQTILRVFKFFLELGADVETVLLKFVHDDCDTWRWEQTL
jgi:hypothetical protein